MKKTDPATRLQYLVSRSGALRASLAIQAQNLKKPLVLADKARAGVQWVYRNPVLPLGVGLLLAVVLPKRTLMVFGSRLWGLWNVYNSVRRAIVTKSGA